MYLTNAGRIQPTVKGKNPQCRCLFAVCIVDKITENNQRLVVIFYLGLRRLILEGKVYEKGPVFSSLNAVVSCADGDLLSLDSVLSEKYSLFFETSFVKSHE